MGDDARPHFFPRFQDFVDYCKQRFAQVTNPRSILARDSRDVSRCSLERWNHASESSDFGWSVVALSAILGPEHASILLFLRHGSPGARCSLLSFLLPL